MTFIVIGNNPRPGERICNNKENGYLTTDATEAQITI